ncbi:MAG: ABC transporter ATP-binding protein [Dehalococcoidia bacterium]|nr:MAG: ABC transporter ATP-binding protein [Dehalococcoidia bacterium]
MLDGRAIDVRGVSLTYAGPPPVHALDGVDIEVARGEFVALLGPSGCGKSTLLRILADLVRPTSGEARADGVAYMPQRDLLLPWRRVLGNAVFAAELAGVPPDEAKRRARALLPRFGLEGFEQAWPAQLSGGMRQRLALLRTFLAPRETLLLDEPFGALDAITRRQMQRWLQDVLALEPRTVLLVTHDVEEALNLADTVYVMSPRPGRIVARIPVAIGRPRDAATVTSPGFIALKARLLAALDGDAAHDALSSS